MFHALMLGVFAAAAVTAAVAAHSRTPTRSRCPECGAATNIVLLPPLLRRNRFVHLRWCPSCAWQGLGRNGPERVPGRRVAHASGFHWGDARSPSDSGFEFRRSDPPRAQPPHHPSGFRFGEGPAPGGHPSGFRWAEAATRWGFRFREPGQDDGTGATGAGARGARSA